MQVPLHLLVGRRDRVRHVHLAGAARDLDAQRAGARELVHPAGAQGAGQARRSAREGDGVEPARAGLRAAGLAIVREELHVTGTVRRLPGFLADAVRENRLMRDIFIRTWNTCSPTRVLERNAACPSPTSIATVPTTDAPSRRCTAVCSAATPPRRAGCAGNGNTAATRTIPAASPRSGSRAKGPAIIGQYATMPVRLVVKGREVSGLVGHGRDGRAGTAAPRSRRGAVPHLGPERRRVARSRTVRSVVPAVPETEVAGRRTGAVPGQAAVAPRLPPPALAGADQPADLVPDLAAGVDRRRARARSARRSASSSGSTTALRRLWDRLASKFDARGPA